MITAIIRNRENTLVLDLPRSIYDLYEKLQSVGIIWHEQTVRKMLHDLTYTGSMVGNKRPTVSFQLKKRVKSTPDELVIIENMHEPIISKEDFETVQRMLEKRHKDVDLVPKGVLNGILKCAECGKTCHAAVRKTEKTVNFTAAAHTAITVKVIARITFCQA